MSNVNRGVPLNKAIIFAVKAHDGMLRKGTNTPYILHPLEAAAIVAAMADVTAKLLLQHPETEA